MKRVNTFVDIDTELMEGSKVRAEGSETRAEGSLKRAGTELEQESSKKQKVNDDQETVELQNLMEVIPDEEEVLRLLEVKTASEEVMLLVEVSATRVNQMMGINNDEAGSSRPKCSRQYETVEEVLLHKFIMSSCNGKVATEIQSRELCHEFYSTYEFNEVCADDELKTKKIIKFRLDGRAYSLTLLEFARRLGLYHSKELDEEGFDVYFQGGLCSDEHFNAQEYWLSIIREENLSLPRSHASTIRNPVLRVVYKMITYGLCQRTIGLVDREMDKEKRSWYSERESMICCGQFITKIAKKARVLSDEVGAYNPPGYAQPQYDQYYQKYPPPQPPQQQPDDDDELCRDDT
ncbi:hypothetical protein Tco_0722509, partial [Tanacetum coccineum]